MKSEIANGFCHCGCGGKTTIAKQTYSERNWIKGKPNRFITGHNSKKSPPNWKGDKVGKSALHRWVKYHRGKPKKCEDCGTTKQNEIYQWANISKEYKRDVKDFKRLCIKCHRKFDRKYPLNSKCKQCGIKIKGYVKKGGFCLNCYFKDSYNKDKEKHRKRSREYYKKNIEKSRKRARDYYYRVKATKS